MELEQLKTVRRLVGIADQTSLEDAGRLLDALIVQYERESEIPESSIDFDAEKERISELAHDHNDATALALLYLADTIAAVAAEEKTEIEPMLGNGH
jgi:hypothetical protein